MAGAAALDRRESLAELINSMLYENIVVSIGGGLVRRVEISRRRVVVELVAGARISIRPFVHLEIRLCDPDRSAEDCYLESVSLIAEDGGKVDG